MFGLPFSLVALLIAQLCGASHDDGATRASLQERQIFQQFVPQLSLGQSTSDIIRMSTSFIPGSPPKTMSGSLMVGPALYDKEHLHDGDLIQTVVQMLNTRIMGRMCSPRPNQWCIQPRVVHGDYLIQWSSSAAAIDATDNIAIQFVKAPGPGGMWNQTLFNVSKRQQIVNFMKGNAPAKWFEIGIAVEGRQNAVVGAQYYRNTTITLQDPDPNLGKTLKLAGTIQADQPITRDGGLSWFIANIMVPPITLA